MADRVDYYFRQRVTEAELDLGFELLERADRNLAADLAVRGIIGGAVPAPHEPIADLTIDLTAPTRGYDRLGQRIFFGTGQRVDCSTDHAGLPTEVPTVGQERWLGVFLRFERLLSDPRTDGNSREILFRRDESFEIVVRQGPAGAVGAASRVVLEDDALLVCDVLRRNGQPTRVVRRPCPRRASRCSAHPSATRRVRARRLRGTSGRSVELVNDEASATAVVRSGDAG